MNIKTKGIISIVGASFLHLMIGSYRTWFRFFDYYVSYVHHKNVNQSGDSLTVDQGTLITPLIRLIYTSCIPLGIYLSSKIGVYLPLFLSIFLILFSHMLLILTTSITSNILSVVLFGCSIGISFFPLISNIWNYFPGRKGTIIGIISTAFGAGDLIFQALGSVIINPNRVEKNEGKFYSYEIAANVVFYIKVLVVIFFVLGVIGGFLTYPWTSSIMIENQKEGKKNNSFIKGVDYDSENEDSFADASFRKEPFGMAVKSKPFFQMCFVFLLANVFNALYISNDMSFGESIYPKKVDFLQKNALLFGVTDSIFRIFWGRVLDNYNFKHIYLLIIFLQIFIFSTFYFVSGISFLFVLYSFLTGLTNSCGVTFLVYSFVKMFGVRNGGYLYSISEICTALFSFGVPNLISYLNSSRINFLILFLANSILKMLSAIVLCFLEEKRFDYGKKEKEQMLKTRFSNSINSE